MLKPSSLVEIISGELTLLAPNQFGQAMAWCRSKLQGTVSEKSLWSRLDQALRRTSSDVDRGHRPNDSATSVAASRSSSASTRSSIERANTIPPTHSAAMARARCRATCQSRPNACSKTSIITLSTVSNACRTRSSLRKNSVGKAIKGQVPSMSSKCSSER